MNLRTRTFIVLGSFCLGASLSHAFTTDPDAPEPRTVTKTVVKTKTVTRTVKVPTPLPADCRKAIKTVGEIATEYGPVSEAAGGILLGLQRIGVGMVTDMQVLNQAILAVRINKNSLDTGTVRALAAEEKLAIYLTRCRRATGR